MDNDCQDLLAHRECFMNETLRKDDDLACQIEITIRYWQGTVRMVRFYDKNLTAR